MKTSRLGFFVWRREIGGLMEMLERLRDTRNRLIQLINDKSHAYLAQCDAQIKAESEFVRMTKERQAETRLATARFVAAVKAAEQLIAQRDELHALAKETSEQLLKWAYESRAGGWSTHQEDPQRKLAERINELVRRIRIASNYRETHASHDSGKVEMKNATQKQIAATFTEWERRYRENPAAFQSEAEKLLKETPKTYGDAAAPYFLKILAEMQGSS